MSEPWLRADWPAPPRVHAFTTLRYGAGVSQPPFDTFNLGNRHAASGDDAAAVERNRAELVERARLPSIPHWLRQVHGCGVERVETPLAMPRAAADEPEADSAVTAVPGAVLAVLTADCLPVLLCARDGHEVAAAHAGWRGLADGVLEATVDAMSTPAGELLAWLGPAAGPAHYEVGADVFDAFVSRDWGAASAFTSTRPGHWRVDLYALARRRLIAAGVAAAAISGGTRCTIGEPDAFFSHRRDRRSGRIASLVWIDPG
jgi:YfiH family protein